jgi:hypothetical protein
MNCDYCGSKVKKSEIKMTDVGDQVCIPCLVGKPVEMFNDAMKKLNTILGNKNIDLIVKIK